MNDDKLIVALQGFKSVQSRLSAEEADARFEDYLEKRKIERVLPPKREVTSSGAWDHNPVNKYAVKK